MTPELNTLHDNAEQLALHSVSFGGVPLDKDEILAFDTISRAYLDLREKRGLPGKRICGPQIALHNGGWYDFETPENSEYDAEDIAYSLAKIARMNGHNLSKSFAYSVAQHCVMGSYTTSDPNLAFEFLLHDAPEFVMGDMTTPLKQLCPDYQHYYKLTERDMARRFYLPYPMSAAAKEIDIRMFATEARDLMQEEDYETLLGVESYDFRVCEWKVEHAARAWLDRFNELWPAHKAKHEARALET